MLYCVVVYLHKYNVLCIFVSWNTNQCMNANAVAQCTVRIPVIKFPNAPVWPRCRAAEWTNTSSYLLFGIFEEIMSQKLPKNQLMWTSSFDNIKNKIKYWFWFFLNIYNDFKNRAQEEAGHKLGDMILKFNQNSPQK